jgi:taurine--2-oxoglutarate transaminase
MRGVTLRTGTFSSGIVFVTAPAQPRSKARAIISTVFVGGAEARMNGFLSVTPRNSTCRVGIVSWLPRAALSRGRAVRWRARRAGRPPPPAPRWPLRERDRRTNLTLQLTGDPRRWPSEPGAPGVIRVLDPEPYHYSFGRTDEEKTAQNLLYLEEILAYENPQSIAAMIIETVTGTNGVLPPPAGYLQGLKALLQKHGILLICDEVMAGMGRTGRMMAYEHGGIVPDIVTMAKGLTSSYFPLGAMGVSDAIAAHFRKNVFWGGLTYNSHPLGLATAEAVIRVMLDEKMIENAARLEGVMRAEMARLQAKHPSMAAGRCIGLFGMIDVRKNARNEPLAPYNGSHPAMVRLGKFFGEEGLFTFVHWGSFTCVPPLCITEEQLRDGFAIIDRGLEITDAVYEG